ncbi:MAG: FAD-linked oxidase C-terminal domain-containing protein [Pyrinomonadaceae bacterium]
MDTLIENLRALVGRDAVLADASELLVYECDGLPQHKYLPRAVVFPKSTEETAEVMRSLKRAGVPFTPRGAGTGLSGGALALERGVVIEMARMRKILNIDAENRTALVQTGVVNAHVSRAVAHLGLHYVPDPSSQGTCTIGGNIAESAGGIHCLKYGTTTDHVLGVKVVLAGGEVLELGEEAQHGGYDLLGVFVGSEGTFGIATEALLRLVPVPPAVRTLLAEFAEVDAASQAVSAIIAAGVMPAALEMMDREIIRAVEASVFAAGLPLDIGAALLIELDGLEAGIDAEAERVRSICLTAGARNCRLARDESERKKLWAARKGAFGAIGRIAPDSMIQDAVVPRSRLPEVMADAYRISAKFNLLLANVFHAGDGNLHPFICFDSRSADQVRRVKEAGRELMETCVRAGGTITGEHGVGLDKRDFLPLIFSDDDMDVMLRVRRAFDPDGLCNPGKIIPLLKGCGEARVMSEPGAVATGLPHQFTQVSQERGAASQDLAGDPAKRQSLSALQSGKVAETRDAETRKQPEGPSISNEDVASNRLAEIVGAGAVSPCARVPQSHYHPVSDSPLPLITVTPSSIDELREIIRLADREAWSVLPAGAATWLDVGNELKRVNIILSTARLNRILDHEPADLVASAEAGVTLETFNQRLSQGGQWLPLDPPDDGRATLGGVVATASSGAQQMGYGSPRTFVIGMNVLLADGKSLKAGGRVVKNVAGYDLCKLFTGSFGTLGIVTDITFKLRPQPAQETTICAHGPLQSAFAAAWSVYEAGLFPVAIELLSADLAKHCVLTDPGEVQLLIRFAGIEKTVAYQIDKATGLLKGHALANVEVIEDDRSIWRNLQLVPLATSVGLSCRIGLKPSQVRRLIETVIKHSDRELVWQASFAAGRVRVMHEDNSSANNQRLNALRAAAEALGGSLIIEHATPEFKSEIDAWGNLPASTLMTRIKQQLDPAGLFSPGRF